MRQAADLIDAFANSMSSTQNPFAAGLNLQQFAAATQALFPQTNILDLSNKMTGNPKPEKRKRGGDKVKKAKDPNAPKRPPSAYLLFQNDVRKDMQAQFPDKPYHEVLSEISKKWSAMSEEQKMPYNQATSVAKDRYATAKNSYDQAIATGAYTPGNGAQYPVAAAPIPAVAEDSDDSDDDSDDSDDDDEDTPAVKKVKAAPTPKPAKEKKHKHAS